MMETLTYSGTIVIETCWCGMKHGVPIELRDHMLSQYNDGRTQQGIYCPLGHKWLFVGKGRAAQLEEELRLQRGATERAQAKAIQAGDERDTAIRRLRATKGVLTLTKKRVAKGSCPCCKSKFTDLAAHMAEKHPDYTGDQAKQH